MCWGENQIDTLYIARNGDIKKATEKFIENNKSKIRVIDVSCFSMTGDYVCPYYGQNTEESENIAPSVGILDSNLY